VNLKYFIVNKIERIKSPDFEGTNVNYIDVNNWFKINGLNPSNMNEIRQFIFDEWIAKKLKSLKNKITEGSCIIIVYEDPTESFIKFLEQKIEEIFSCESCELILLP
jgi:hypothetical protein